MPPILSTKLNVPPARPGLVIRRRLIERLDAGVHGKLTVVTAPPGFGKTTLVSDWAREHSVAWLSLDQTDNDPTRFWSHLAQALDTAHPGIVTAIDDLIRAPHPPPRDVVLSLLINALTMAPETVLVLDDYQMIESAQIHEALAFTLDRLPPQAHLVIISRSDPPIPLARLRVRGELTELRDADLRFRPEEVALFLRHTMGLSLSPDDISALEARTEGWIAGLQLAALSLRGQPDPSAFVRAFAGSHRYVFDYLLEEVLSRQPAETEAFLLDTSILDRLSGPLCDAVTRRDDGQEQLERLERAHLFVSPMDDEHRWYRYHRLFADVLRHRLRRLHAEREPELHRRAATWYEREQLIPDAVKHALAATDYPRAAYLIERAAETMWTQGELATLLAWIDALPNEVLRTRPRLLIALAWVEFLADRFVAADRLLRDAEQAAGHDPTTTDIPGVLSTMRAALLVMQDAEPPAVIDLAERAFAWLPAGYGFWHRVAGLALGLAYDALGEPAPAVRALSTALERALRDGDGYLGGLIAWNLLRVEGAAGDLLRGIDRGREVVEIVRESWRASDVGHVQLSLGRLLYQADELDEAARHLEEGISAVHQRGLPRPLVKGYISLARVKSARGDERGAEELLTAAEETAHRHGISGRLARVAPYRARFDLAHGRIDAAAEWARRNRIDGEASIDAQDDFERDVELLVLARLRIAEGRIDAARALLGRLEQSAERSGRVGNLIEILVVTALAHLAGNERDQARTTLQRALALAAPRGYVRVFVDEGGAMRGLLAEIPATPSIPADFLARLLSAFPQPEHPGLVRGRPGPVHPLSDRELEVLRLLASGSSNRAIADQLFVTVPTAKKHVANILDKLDVANRTQAAARARDIGLI